MVAVAASAVLSQWGKHDALVEGAFLLGIPALVAFGMLYWVGELARMRRVYDFICVVEAKVELALQHTKSERSTEGWYVGFERRWKDEGGKRLGELGLIMPRRGSLKVTVGAAPIEFERWLRNIRNLRASNNLSWVFMFRLALFPAAILTSWSTGFYYLLTREITPKSHAVGVAVAACGAVISVIAIWLATELASDLNDPNAARKLNRMRRWLRNRVHRVLILPDWSSVDVEDDTADEDARES